MKDENIKEILEDVKRHLDYVKATKQCSIRDNEMKAMYDYITNLQNENMKYDQCLTELTDNYKDLQKELTNLQEEINHLKQNKERTLEYIEEHIKYEHDGYNFYSYHLYNFNKDDLLNLLQGKSDE